MYKYVNTHTSMRKNTPKHVKIILGINIKSIPNHELERLKQKAQEISGSKTEYQNEYSTLLIRRLNHEPIQYIEEFMPFYTVQLKVDERALIPRPETEYLIEIIKNKVVKPKSILDVGTGSGCILSLIHI